jgi:Ca-activated chloride channel family protein
MKPGSGPFGHARALAVTAAFAGSIAVLGAQQPPAVPLPSPPGPPAATGGAPQSPQFRSSVDVVSLHVTVSDATAPLRYVTDLEASDFEVFENGVKQEITLFNKTNSPIALALLLDASASMDSKIQTVQEAAIGFARRLRPQDLAEVIEFNSRAAIPQAFTNEVPKLERAIRMTSANGPTALYQALYIAMSEFKKLRKNLSEDPSLIRRQAVVLISDGQDTASMFTFDDILVEVKRSETAVYAIGLRSPSEPTSRGFNLADFELRQLAQQTGGRTFFPNQVSDLATVYGQIADELSSQYTLGYTSKNQRRDGAWRPIVVRVTKPNAVPRTKLGYFAPTR